MDEKERWQERNKFAKAEYMKGFEEKCAEHGLDADELLKGLLTGETSDDLVKKAQDVASDYSGMDKTAGFFGDVWSGLKSGVGGLASGLANTAGNIGNIATGGLAKGLWNTGKQFVSGESIDWGQNFNPFAAKHWENPLQGFSDQAQANAMGMGSTAAEQKRISAKTYEGLDPSMQHYAFMQGRAPSMADQNRWSEQQWQEKQKAQNASGQNNLAAMF